jgi:hypothetical protein
MKTNFAEIYKQRLANEIVRQDKQLAAILSEPGPTGLLYASMCGPDLLRAIVPPECCCSCSV